MQDSGSDLVCTMALLLQVKSIAVHVYNYHVMHRCGCSVGVLQFLIQPPRGDQE